MVTQRHQCASSSPTRKVEASLRASLAGLLVLVLGGCTDETPEGAPESTSAASASASDAYEPFVAPCTGVPAGYGPTVNLPAGAAIAAEPLLSNLDVLLQQAGLVETLDSAPALTVLAPIDPVLQVLPADAYQINLQPPRLQPLLNHHLINTRLPLDQLVPGQTTRNGDGVTFFPEGDTVTVPADNTLLRQTPATICGVLKTTNATVYLIDQVLLPRP